MTVRSEEIQLVIMLACKPVDWSRGMQVIYLWKSPIKLVPKSVSPLILHTATRSIPLLRKALGIPVPVLREYCSKLLLAGESIVSTSNISIILFRPTKNIPICGRTTTSFGKVWTRVIYLDDCITNTGKCILSHRWGRVNCVSMKLLLQLLIHLFNGLFCPGQPE